jgi:GWxTD domain-containing protein
MKRVALLAAIALSCCSAYGQADLPPAITPDVPQFYVDALCFASEHSGESRLDVYVEVPYEAIHFMMEDGLFRSSYEITINIYDAKEHLVEDKWWTERVETKSYDESVSATLGNLSQRSFTLPPGQYSIVAQVKEKETDKTLRLTKKVAVREFGSTPFLISDVMLVNRIDTVEGKKVVYPNISSNVGELRSGFTIYFEAYNQAKADSMRVFVTIRNTRGDAVQQDTFSQALALPRAPCFHRLTAGRLIAGDYLLELAAVPLSAAGTELQGKTAATASRSFVVRWRDMPVSITNLDLAIDQLTYVADRDNLDAMKEAPAEAKRKLFGEFWKKRDPTPGTERNELMEEYYSRVAYANKHFGHYVEGWKTDMGMVYIIFGAPMNIERHPFDINAKPYEVWTYYEQNRQFVFIDATGFGDYRLQDPIWDLRSTRPR